MSSAVPNKRPAPVNFEDKLAEARKRAAETKARLEAKMAGVSTGSAAAGASAGGPASSSAAVERVRERAQALKAKVAAAAGSAAQPSAAASARDRVEALKARDASASSRVLGSDHPPPRALAQSMSQQPDFRDPTLPATGPGRGGLSIGIHPALLGDIQDRGRVVQKPRARSKREEKSNPYLSDAAVATRAKRTLNFNHNMQSRPAMQAANEMRRKAHLEQMKRRIQAQAEKAGLEESTEVQAFAVPMPPDVEFWDEQFEDGVDNNEAISRLVVHPILIEPPQEKFVTLKQKPLMLTKPEMKKIRRMRRAEQHKEEQAKIRLGMIPTPAPKIKHSNVMRVYGELAVKDPTAVEAMVNKQIAERQEAHMAANAERQLTKEEKAQKMAQKARENAAKGLNQCVFKIALGKEKLLGKHRYKIDVNAKQYVDITGCVIVAPSVTLCIIEGGEHSTRKYKHLMLNRIKWQAILNGGGEVHEADDDDEDNKDTTCTLLWQGQVRYRKFKKWGSIREVETDVRAKEALKRAKMENFWTLAKTST
jgi:U4/U6 small nuclear ribonucleoprotein PRP3